MNWIPYQEALRHFRAINSRRQLVALPADIATLHKDIPLSPHVISPGDGLWSEVYRWYGQIGVRCLTVEYPVDAPANAAGQILVTTPFMEAAPDRCDWTILLELQDLPRSIHVARPLFIEGRVSNPRLTVYRPDPRGWNDAVYGAASSEDAESLLAYLRQDPWNDGCLVGEAELPGYWTILLHDRGVDQIVGAYPSKNSALSVACEYSLRNNPQSTLIVKDRSDTNSPDVYHIRDGRVVAVER